MILYNWDLLNCEMEAANECKHVVYHKSCSCNVLKGEMLSADFMGSYAF